MNNHVFKTEKAIKILGQLGIQVVMGSITIDYLMSLEELKENIEFLEKMNVLDKNTEIFFQIH